MCRFFYFFPPVLAALSGDNFPLGWGRYVRDIEAYGIALEGLHDDMGYAAVRSIPLLITFADGPPFSTPVPVHRS